MIMKNQDYHILLVDDEPDILEFLGYNLRKEGFTVQTALNGREAIELAKQTNPHLVILDVMMPEMDGIETCREMRKVPELADSIIAFLTARNEDYSQLAGFEAGGDDYIAKPIKPSLLISRVKALLRRYSRNEERPEGLRIANLLIDRERYLVMKDGEKLVLPKKEFELLSLLASKPNKVFSREEIFAGVWGTDVVVGDRTIDVHVRKIREKIGIENIKTVKGVGYKFEI
jgi:two-component system, OmpR family, alkaline phosphatase synthesis response regulator PhoP